MTTSTAELQRIVELGKRATARPWHCEGFELFRGNNHGQIGRVDDAEYIAAAANSADNLAAIVLLVGEYAEKCNREAGTARSMATYPTEFSKPRVETAAEVYAEVARELLGLIGRE